MTTISKRIDFTLFFDVKNGNPNGDPDAGNMPRMDPETGHGQVTDGCIKRKIRNYVSLAMADQPGHEIYFAQKAVLNNQHLRAYEAQGLKHVSKKLPKDGDQAKAITDWMCQNFWDIRTFGAVMTTDVNAGDTRGPVQITFAESVEPISPIEATITRQSVTNEKDIDKERTMGSKHIVPYGLYYLHGFINVPFAEKTGFTDDDLNLLMMALRDMFENDRSASRGMMATRELILFRHESRLGNAQAHKLFDRITVSRKTEGGLVTVGTSEANALEPARSFKDYEITVDMCDIPNGVSVEKPW
jgi:CRISPR-associated protein Csd2